MKNEKLQVYVDYTDLNKACLKDSFSILGIDQLVDTTTRYELLTFINALGYYQIPMYPNDKEKTSFIIEKRMYCYKVMLFGLKNVGATY